MCVSIKSWLSELVHLTCYRICARGLSATIRYHNRSVTTQSPWYRYQVNDPTTNGCSRHYRTTSSVVRGPCVWGGRSSYRATVSTGTTHRTTCVCRENHPRKGGICVANHTTPIDIVILANDGCYAMVSRHHSSSDTCHGTRTCLTCLTSPGHI